MLSDRLMPLLFLAHPARSSRKTPLIDQPRSQPYAAFLTLSGTGSYTGVPNLALRISRPRFARPCVAPAGLAPSRDRRRSAFPARSRERTRTPWTVGWTSPPKCRPSRSPDPTALGELHQDLSPPWSPSTPAAQDIPTAQSRPDGEGSAYWLS